MAYRHIEPINRQVTIIVGLSVVGLMAFGLAHSFYRNVLFEQTLEEIEQGNNGIRGKIDQAHRDLEYYRSAQYKDKYAKENLGLLRSGEKVLIITEQPGTPFLETQETSRSAEQQEARYFELLRQMPVLEHWQLYVFHREKIEELKRGL